VSEAPPFSPRVVVALGGLVLAIFAASVLLTGGGARDTAESFGANSYSRSAIGHLALYDMLRALGRDAVRADVDPLAQLGAKGVLVLAEPSEAVFDQSYRTKILTAKKILLILPKWEARADPDHPDWIGEAGLVPEALAESALFPAEPKAKVKDAPAPILYTTNRLGVAPTIADTAQLAQASAMNPLLANENGVLVGEILDRGRRIVVLVDPDPIENHGLSKGENAAFALALFDFIGGPGAKFLFDETIHGFHGHLAAASPALALLRFPGNLLALQGLVAAVLLVGATIGRFGPPLPAPRAFGAGKAALVSNIAQLIDHGGHHAHSLKRYIETTAKEGAAILRAPPDLSESERIAWLDRAGQARGARRACSEILFEARTAGDKDLARLLAAAREIHQWKLEITHGAG
jgi:Domain of unknown function (DUF4350)